jgi:hypothetical protein
MLKDVDGDPDPALCATIPLAVYAMFQLKVVTDSDCTAL